MNKTKKPRIPLMRSMLIIVVISVIVTVSFFAVSSRNYFDDLAINESRNAAKIAYVGAEELIYSEITDIEDFDNEAVREKLHYYLQRLCCESEIEYMFCYTLDDQGIRHFLMYCASDEKAENEYWEEYYYGITEDEPVSEAEIKALAGDRKGNYEFRQEFNDYICAWIFPLTDEDGNVDALMEIDYKYIHIADLITTLRIRSWLMVIVVMAFTLIIARVLFKSFVLKPISILSKDMELFSKDKSINYEKRNTHIANEVTDIEDSFESMVKDITGYMKDIEKFTARDVQIRTQMDVATKIQQGVVPDKYGIKGKEYDVFGASFPAREVGGDFYDIFFLSENKLCAIIGDISGKGISAALFMMLVKSSIREKIRAGIGVAKALNETNDYICSSNTECMFATIFALILDLDTGKVTYANAGHNPPIILSDEPRVLNVESGIVLGLFDDMNIKENTLFLKEGEGIFLYTDGITEAVNREGEQFGMDCMITHMRSYKVTSGFEARQKSLSLIDKVVEHEDGLDQFDDITCLMALYGGKEIKEESERSKLAADDFQRVKETIFSVIKDEDRAKNAILACEEIYANILDYSGADRISFVLEEKEDRLGIKLVDNGKSFDPVNARPMEKKFEELDLGGMGIMLAKEFSRDMNYKREMNRNILSLTIEKDTKVLEDRT